MSNRVRIVTYAWGDRYIGDLLNTTIPALLAPGNLPALVAEFDCDFVFLSQEEKFDAIRAHPAFVRLSSFCPTRLVSLDDLVVGPWYGISLTFALLRGIADLGAAMTDTFCVFLNADFILADGSFRSLAEKMKAGERLIVAPSYCVISEAVAPLLRLKRDDARMELSISPREMAALALKHRHYTIRAKTINQSVIRTHRHDQFYWYVDDQTLLARQLPIAVVCMKPQIHLEEMRTFWDYGLVSEACPDVVPCVLGDSDEFLMIELRDERTYGEFISLGWPTIQEIADDLSSFSTKDHRDYGLFTLVLHAADLPADMQREADRLDAFMRELYSRMKPTPVSYLDHPFWSNSIDDFKHMSAAYLLERGKQSDAAAIDSDEGGAPPRSAFFSGGFARRAATWRNWGDRRRLYAIMRPLVQRAYSRVIGSLPKITRNHPYWCDLNLPLALLQTVQDRPETRVLIVKSQQNIFKKLVDGGRVQEETTGHIDVLLPSLGASGQASASSPMRELLVYGGVDIWAEDAPNIERATGALILKSDADMLVHVGASSGLSRAMVATSVLVTVDRAGFGATLGREVPHDDRQTSVTGAARIQYDLCLCDLSDEDFVYFRQIYSSIRPRMRTGAKVLALFLNRSYRVFDPQDGLMIKNAFPLSDLSCLHFQGSRWTRLTRWLFERGVVLTGAPGLSGRLAATGLLLASFALAGIINRLRRNARGKGFVSRASSLALELTVKRPASPEAGRS